MKKNILSVLFVFFGLCFAQQYKINNVDYNIEGSGIKLLGKTSSVMLERNVPVDRNTVFENYEQFTSYIKKYEQNLLNLRAFDEFTINQIISEEPYEDDIFYVDLIISLKDSIHMLALPYFKYDSNVGTQIKLKAKDTNFLGTLNPMSADILLEIKQQDINAKASLAPGFNFKYDFPFKAGPFESTWINDYGISYTVGNDIAEWSAKSGVKMDLPGNFITYSFEFYQSFYNNLDYAADNDAMYFNEEAKFSIPLKLHEFESIGKLNYTPYIDVNFNWDYDGINESNTDLSSPVLTLGHSLSTSKINWNNNFRTGNSFNISNSYAYNFQRHFFYPYISTEALLFKNFVISNKPIFNTIGLTSDLYYFAYFLNADTDPYFDKDGEKIGGRLRGIRDDQAICKTTSAFVFNFDLPVRLFEINFTKSFLKYFSCDVQLSPFVDIALTYNKITENWYNPKDGLYASGLEVLVYPKKWSSFTVRVMAGVDIGRLLFKNHLNFDIREDVSPYEFSIGIGLHY